MLADVEKEIGLLEPWQDRDQKAPCKLSQDAAIFFDLNDMDSLDEHEQGPPDQVTRYFVQPRKLLQCVRAAAPKGECAMYGIQVLVILSADALQDIATNVLVKSDHHGSEFRDTTGIVHISLAAHVINDLSKSKPNSKTWALKQKIVRQERYHRFAGEERDRLCCHIPAGLRSMHIYLARCPEIVA